jgi:SAM-dependent methyltransferase
VAPSTASPVRRYDHELSIESAERGAIMAEHSEWTPPPVDGIKASPARAYDYLLGGKDNYAADRAAAEAMLTIAPDTRLVARANRAFLARAVRLLAKSGVRQFIDLGSGIPTSPNVHEVAREVHPDARVAYVDNDPVVIAHDRALLATDPGTTAIKADIRRPADVLTDSRLRKLIDFDEPVGILLAAVLHVIGDEDDPAAIVAKYCEHMAPGSHLVISHFSADSDAAAMAHASRSTHFKVAFRSRDEILRWFDGLELIDPGLVTVQHWRPDADMPRPKQMEITAGVGRKT